MSVPKYDYATYCVLLPPAKTYRVTEGYERMKAMVLNNRRNQDDSGEIILDTYLV